MAEQKRIKKRNNFTLSKEAQDKVNAVPAKQKSKFVSEAIVYFTPIATKGKFHETGE